MIFPFLDKVGSIFFFLQEAAWKGWAEGGYYHQQSSSKVSKGYCVILLGSVRSEARFVPFTTYLDGNGFRQELSTKVFYLDHF